MHVAHVTATFRPYQGGTGNVCYYHARELARRGHAVDVFTAAMRGAPRTELADGMHIHRLPALLQIGNAPILPGLVSALRGFDLIHLHYPFILGAEMARAASALYHAPLVISFHNDLIGDGTRAAILALYQRASAALTVSSAARVCAVSLDHYHASNLGQALGNRREVAVELPNGVDVDHFCPSGPAADLAAYGIPPDARVALFVAALDRAHHFKRLDRLLQAAKHLPPEVYLLVVGDGDLRAGYEQEAHALGLTGRIVFVGSVGHEAMPPLFRAAHLTVMPSTPPESFGLALVESLACGTPVIAANIPGVRTVVEHGSDGLLVDAGDPAALAAAIQQILADEATRQAMGQRGRAKVQARYAWPVIGARLETIYREVLR
jgi:glycosyltransferase involved in cell wall biosynthesis